MLTRAKPKPTLLAIAAAAALIMSLNGCAPQKADEAQATEEASISQVSFAWSEASDCSVCHSKESSSMNDAACLAYTHQQQGNDCFTCHADTAGLESAHAEATPELAEKRATKLRSTKIDRAACLSCHGGEEGYAESTASSTVLTDTQGKTVNPHAMPENADHADTDCSSCHDMHGSAPASDSAPEYCATCHHSGVYECHTCHE